MEPILNKEEIAELLAAIKSGQLPAETDNGAAINANVSPLNLFQMAETTEGQSRTPNLDIILDDFAQNFAITLTNQLQRSFTLTRTEIKILSFQDYLLSQKDAGAIGVLNLEPLKNGALLVFDGELSFNLLEIMLGASTEMETLQPDRKPTKIELNVLKSSIATACKDIDKSLKQVVDINSSLVKVESNSRLVSIAEAEAEVEVGRFTVTVGEVTGVCDLVFPTATLDPVKEQLRDLLTIKTVKQSGWHDILLSEIQEMSTTVIAQSGTITLPVRKVMNFKVGDIIGIDYDPNSPLRVLVEDSPKFFAIPGTINGKKAIHLTDVSDQGE